MSFLFGNLRLVISAHLRQNTQEIAQEEKKNSFLCLKKINDVDKFRKVVILEVDVLIIVHRLPPLAP